MALEHISLAIVQAAAYVSQRVPCYLVSQYLGDFEDDVMILRNYFFVFVNNDGITFEMHGQYS